MTSHEKDKKWIEDRVSNVLKELRALALSKVHLSQKMVDTIESAITAEMERVRACKAQRTTEFHF